MRYKHVQFRYQVSGIRYQVLGVGCWAILKSSPLGGRVRESIFTGLSFGLTSAVITTLGLMVGLYSGTGSRPAVIGGILTIALADAFSDALGIHISEESESRHGNREVWVSTFSTFFSKLIFGSSFLVPVLFLELFTALVVSIVWGLSILSFLSYKMAVRRKSDPWKAIAEHLFIACMVIIMTHLIGKWISRFIT